MKDVSVIFPIIKIDYLSLLALENLFNQITSLDYEIIIIIDNPDINLKEKLISDLEKKNYKKIKYKIIQNERNIGLTKSLNIAIKNSSGKYIMRNDQDDVSEKNRLQEQYNLLEKSENKKICFSNFYIKKKNKTKKRNIFKESKNLEKILEFKNPIAHSSVMIEKNFFSKIGFYNEKFIVSQDFEAWTKLSNLDESIFIFSDKYLVTLNIDDNNISVNHGYSQRYNSIIICLSKSFKNTNFIYDKNLINFISINKIYEKKQVRDKFNSLVFCYLYDRKEKINIKINVNFFVLVFKNYYYHRGMLVRRFFKF